MLKRYIWLIAGLIIGYLLLSRRSKLPAAIEWLTGGFSRLWGGLTQVKKENL